MTNERYAFTCTVCGGIISDKNSHKNCKGWKEEMWGKLFPKSVNVIGSMAHITKEFLFTVIDETRKEMGLYE